MFPKENALEEQVSVNHNLFSTASMMSLEMFRRNNGSRDRKPETSLALTQGLVAGAHLHSRGHSKAVGRPFVSFLILVDYSFLSKEL